MLAHTRTLVLCWLLSALKPAYAARNCQELLEAANGGLSSGAYNVVNANGDTIRIYCQFYSGYGYAFVSGQNTASVDYSLLSDDTSHVVIRHKRGNGVQYTATLAQMTAYASTPVSIQWSGYTSYQGPINKVMTPYVFVGFIPRSYTYRNALQGWSCNGQDYTFSNCDANPNSYITFLFNHGGHGYTSYVGGKNTLMYPWYDHATAVTAGEYLPDDFLASYHEIHHGGCGGYSRGSNVPDVVGGNAGVKFTINCAVPPDATGASKSYTGTSVGSTVTYTCSGGYSVLSGSATRTCSGSGAWSGSTPVCGVHGNWAAWSSWSSCSVTCASGTWSRSRTCTNPAPVNGNSCSGPSTETSTCTLSPCPVDGEWTTWTSWATCDVTCGGGSTSRERTCTNPAPNHGGQDCQGNPSETMACNTHNCPINGEWTSWSSWSSCPVTCGGSTITRSRSCTNPAPLYGGMDCTGDMTESQSCNTNPCPVDGEWTTWTSWATCDVTCGGGSTSRERTCTNPAPNHGGQDCQGNPSETMACNTHNCPINGEWTSWSSWSSCPVTCGGSTITRSRSCTNPVPQYGGLDCTGDMTESQSCNTNPCPVDGGWSSWSAYDACSATCLGGWRNRTRDCVNPAPAHGGADCVGDAWETDFCNDIACNIPPPIDGNWGSWEAWQGCSVTCGSGVQRRYRACDNPPPDNGGLPCSGDAFQENPCSGSGSCPVAVDGNWGAWSALSACSATCGYGRALKVRQCDNPVPSNGGRLCTGDSLVFEACIDQVCSSNGTSGDGNSYGASYQNVCPLGYFTCQAGSVTCIQEMFCCDCTSDCDDSSDENRDWAGCTTMCDGANGNRCSVVFMFLMFVVLWLNKTLF